MEKNQVNIPMFSWFEMYAFNNEIDYPFAEKN